MFYFYSIYWVFENSFKKCFWYFILIHIYKNTHTCIKSDTDTQIVHLTFRYTSEFPLSAFFSFCSLVVLLCTCSSCCSSLRLGHRGDGRGTYSRSGWPGQLRHGHPRGEAGAVHGLRGGQTPAVSACTSGCWHWQPGTDTLWVPAPLPGSRPWTPAQMLNTWSHWFRTIFWVVLVWIFTELFSILWVGLMK